MYGVVPPTGVEYRLSVWLRHDVPPSRSLVVTVGGALTMMPVVCVLTQPMALV